MLEDALAFPRNSDNWLTTLIIGAALSFFSFLFIPGLIVQGYMLRVARTSAEGGDRPPEFGEWVELLIDGVKAFVVALVYGIVPSLVIVFLVSILTGGAIASAMAGSESGAAGFGLLLVLVVLVAVPLLILVGYLTLVAQIRLAVTDSLGAAFEIGAVVSTAFNWEFFVAFLLALVVVIGLSIVGGILVVVLVGFLILFYAQMSMYYLLGRGYADATR